MYPQTTLLQLLSMAIPIAFGQRNILSVFHDFRMGRRRLSLFSVLCEALKARFNQTDEQLQAALDKHTGADIVSVLQVCQDLGRQEDPPVKVTVVFFADEVQYLFEPTKDPPPSKLLDEMAIVAQARGVAFFFLGNGHHLVDQLANAGLNGTTKMPTVRLLPVTTKRELVATQPCWHESWLSTAGLTVPVGSQLDEALVRRLFLETGGLFRPMIDFSSYNQPHLPEPRGLALAVLAHLYSANRTVIEKRAEEALPVSHTVMQKIAARRNASAFDPFNQAQVPVRDLSSILSDEADLVAAADIHQLADAGWCLLSLHNHNECASFLFPKHYAYMESQHLHLSLLDCAAIWFPEGRTLGERWEAFYAEHLQETHQLGWAPTTSPDYGYFRWQEQHEEAWFLDHVNTVFKPFPH